MVHDKYGPQLNLYASVESVKSVVDYFLSAEL